MEQVDYHTQLVQMQNGTATLENGLVVSYKFQHTFTTQSHDLPPPPWYTTQQQKGMNTLDESLKQ